MAALPASIGRYRPVALLGSGAMGTVYKAHDPLIDRMVAVKVVRADALDPDIRTGFLERFRHEVQAAGRCSHPAIVGVYDFVEGDGDPSLVMELVEGRTLQQILRDPSERAAARTVPMVLQVLDGLGCAHAQGVVHRDIKPANIIVTLSGQAKIADFGIARLNEAVLTQAGAMVGTPHYMAPEQVSDDAVDRRADLFAVGAILYEILAGRPPFVGRTLAETVQRLAGPEPADMAPVADRQCIPVLQRALAKDRARRFQTAAEFAAALQTATDPSQATLVQGMRVPGMPVPGMQAAGTRAEGMRAEATRGAAGPATPEPPTLGPPTLGAPTLGAPTLGSATRQAAARAWDPALLQRLERQLAVYLGPMARRAVAQAAEKAGSVEELHAALARTLPRTADRTAFLRSLGGARVQPSLTTLRRSEPAAPTLAPRTQSAPTLPAGPLPAGSIPGGPLPGGPLPGGPLPGGPIPDGPIPGEPTPGGPLPVGSVPATAVPARPVASEPRPAGPIPGAAVTAAQGVLAFFVGPIARVLAREAAGQAVSPRDFLERLCAHVPRPDEQAALRRRLRTEVEPHLR